MILYGYHWYIPDQQMWQIPKQGPKAPYHAHSLPNTPSRVSKEQQSGSCQELVQVDNIGNRWKCLLLAGGNQNSNRKHSDMQQDAREAQKSNQVIRASFLPPCRPLEARYPSKLTGQSKNLGRKGYLQISHLCGPEELEGKKYTEGSNLTLQPQLPHGRWW